MSGWQPKGPFHDDPPPPPSGGSSVQPPGVWIEIPDRFTVRDQFAAAALTGLHTLGRIPEEGLPEKMAEWAYRIADAMMEARKR